MDVQACGVCIGAKPWRENDKMLSLFCEDGNVYDVLARGALKPKYKLKFAAQLFSACDYFLCPSKAGYYILGGAAFSELSFLSVSADPDAFAAACLVCEVVQKSVRAESKRMYAETVAALGELAAGDARCDLVCLRILLAALSDGGYADSFPQNGRGDICRAVLSAPPGAVSSVAADPAIVQSLVKAYANRFAALFGKLNSLTAWQRQNVL